MFETFRRGVRNEIIKCNIGVIISKKKNPKTLYPFTTLF